MDMADPQALSLDVATTSDAALLSNLLELYAYDLSEVFPHVELGPDGRFGYPALSRYWAEPERRFAYIIRCEGRVAGFALATRGSPVSDDPSVFDVAEFFVLRRYRRQGVGRRAAILLWNHLPGKWTVRVSEANHDGLAFWREAIAGTAGDLMTETTRTGPRTAWRVYHFECTAARER
jgi:predicted acetyltransferase